MHEHRPRFAAKGIHRFQVFHHKARDQLHLYALIRQPTIKSLIIINFVGAFISAAQSGGNIMIMTFGRANTEVAELHIFKEAYTNLRFGSAIAMAWILGVTTLLFTIYNLKRLSNMEFKTTGK